MSAIRTVDFDRLASSAPLNRQAAQDYHASGERPVTRNLGPCEVFLAPPATHATLPYGFPVDFTGHRLGNAVVLGLRLRQPTDGKNRLSSWVLRCDCGNYYLRNHRRLTEIPPGAPVEACPACIRDRDALRPSKKKLRKASHRIRMAIAAAREARA